MKILGSIGEAWGLIFKQTLAAIAIVVVMGFITGCSSSGSLNEHSSCQDFEQADTATQDQVLQDMEAAHNSSDNLPLTRASVELYCETHDPGSPIDGIYNNSYVGKQPAQALHISAPLSPSPARRLALQAAAMIQPITTSPYFLDRLLGDFTASATAFVAGG